GTPDGLRRETVVHRWLAVGRQIRQRQHVLDLLLGRAVEYGRRNRRAMAKIFGKRLDLLVGKRVDVGLLSAGFVVDLIEEPANRRRTARLIDHAAALQAETLSGPTPTGLEDSAHDHSRRHAG